MTEFMDTSEAAKLWGVSPTRVAQYCRNNQVYNAKKTKAGWIMPIDAEKPEDGRATRYKGADRLPEGKPLTSIDLFCGPGGLATGFRWAGIKPLIAIEWSDWTIQTYSASHNAEIFSLQQYLEDPASMECYFTPSERTVLIHGDINLVSAELIQRLLTSRYGVNTVDIVTGGAPCESFSMAGDRKEVDDRNYLYQNVLRIARAVDSKMFMFENVKGLFSKKLDGKKGKMYDAICDEFEGVKDGIEYRLASRDKETVLLKAVDYGVPQLRERLFLVGINVKFPDLHFCYPEKTHGPDCSYPFVTVDDAISDLPSLAMGSESTKYTFDIKSVKEGCSRAEFLRRMRGDLSMPPSHIPFEKDTLSSHKAPGHTAKMLARIKLIKQGESMKSASMRLIEEGNSDLVELYFPRKIYAARNRRLRPTEPSFTVTSHCLDEMIHPTANRGLSPREAARLQSFPDWYQFYGPYVKFHSDPQQDQYEQIGDAIPPLLAYALAKEVVRTIRHDVD